MTKAAKQEAKAVKTANDVRLSEIRHKTIRIGIGTVGIIAGLAIIVWAYVRIEENAPKDPSWLRALTLLLTVLSAPAVTLTFFKFKEFLVDVAIQLISQRLDKHVAVDIVKPEADKNQEVSNE